MAVVDEGSADLARENAELRRRLAERTAERDEALAQQAATSEVLQVINASPGDLAPVFDAMLAKAMRLCEAVFGYLLAYDGREFHTVAHCGLPPRFAEYLPRMDQPGGTGAYARIKGGDAFVHVDDLMDGEVYRSSPLRRALVDLGGARTGLIVALRRERTLLGVFTIYRQEVRPFSERQIALLENFAAQAVIAMENARLLTETREALERQTATAEVLQVINSSPGNLAPVFDAMLHKALRLCDAAFGVLGSFDGERFNPVASRGFPQEYGSSQPMPGSANFRLTRGENVIHAADITADEVYRSGDLRRRRFVEMTGARTAIWVALRKDATLLGNIVIFRQEVRPFSDKQIALLQNFAAQAVIAMENARLITETHEALEQQTATAEVLGVINASPGDLTPVFDAMLERATRLCEATYGQLATYDGECFRFVAKHGTVPFLRQHPTEPLPPSDGVTWPRIVAGEPLVHIPDVADTDLYRSGHATARAFVDIGGGRTLLTVALLKDDALLGAISAYRTEVRPFTDKQIALLQNFAAQAVIAMENARLLTETREALEQQTATAEVLQVINSSPGDLNPVFDAMLERATRLCDADFGTLWTFDGDRFRPAVGRGHGAAGPNTMPEGVRPAPGIPLGRLIAGESVAHVVDAATDDAFQSDPAIRARIAALGTRSALAVALRKDDALLGAITANRRRVEPYSDKQITLLQNFAAQAVIAMENARLITETREALEQQTATAEVLQIINASPRDLAPVFDAMLEKAIHLCDAAQGVLWTIDGERLKVAATCQIAPEFAELLRGIERGEQEVPPPLREIIGGKRLIHIADLGDHELYREGHPVATAALERGLVRSLVWVALIKDSAAVGAFAIARREVRPFSDSQIALLQNFAAQAVIAMENARLITETREALEQQTATAEVLQVINSSPGDLAPVFDAILEKAHTLCGAAFGALMTYDGESLRVVAGHNVPPAFEALGRQSFRPGSQNRLATSYGASSLSMCPI